LNKAKRDDILYRHYTINIKLFSFMIKNGRIAAPASAEVCRLPPKFKIVGVMKAAE
jgi:hypothetical protein